MNVLHHSILLCSALAIATTLGCKHQEQADSSPPFDPEPEIRTPQRISKAHAAPADLEIPALPANSETLPELTIVFQDPQGNQRVVSRSRSRVHLAMPERDQEWLFIRNPVDGRRVSGILIDHRHQVLLDYPETDLRVEGVAKGWAEVIAIDERQGKARPGINPEMIRDPAKRFPNYGDFDIADWREELHENGHDHAGHQATPSPLPSTVKKEGAEEHHHPHAASSTPSHSPQERTPK